MAKAERSYDDVPGTYVLDGRSYRKGYHLNMFCMSLNKPEGRAAFTEDAEAYLKTFPMTEEQRTAVLERDWLGMLRLGANVYYTYKIMAFDDLTMQHMSAKMSNPQMTFEEFRELMMKGGRPIEGNRSKKEWEQKNG